MRRLKQNWQITGSKRQARRRGSTLVEFALIVPVLLAMLIGIMEFGWMVKNNLLVANATREGARAAALGKTTDEIQARITNAVQPLSIVSPNGSLLMKWSNNDGSDAYPYTVGNTSGKNNVPAGKLIKITVTSKHTALTGFFPFLNNRNIAVSVIMRREAN